MTSDQGASASASTSTLRDLEDLGRLVEGAGDGDAAIDRALDVVEALLAAGWEPPDGWLRGLLSRFDADAAASRPDTGRTRGPVRSVRDFAESRAEEIAIMRARRLLALQELERTSARARDAAARSRSLVGRSGTNHRAAAETGRRRPTLRRRVALEPERPAPAAPPSSTGQVGAVRAAPDQMEDALASNRAIGAAVGVVMERFHLDRKTAVTYLIRLSQDSNTKLAAVATQLLATAEDSYSRGPVNRRPARK